MSDWSSFEKDKIATDAWRSFLNENTFRPIGEEYRVKGIAPALKGGIGPVRVQKPDAEEDAEEEWEEWEREETEEIEVEDPEDEAEDIDGPSDLPGPPEKPYGPGGEEDDEEDTFFKPSDPMATPVAPSEEEAIARAREKEESLNIKLKTMFGAAMDIGGLASFVPGLGQGVGALFTAASLLNNLTFPQPKYGWAAVDLAGLALAVIPGGTALSKASILGIKAKKAANAAKLAKAAKAADTGADVYKAAKALVAYGTLEEELSEELGEAFAQTIKGLLIKKDDEGNYYSTQAIQKLKEKANPAKDGFKRLTAFEKKVKELQGRAERIDQAPADKLDEAQIKHWQVLAGIKKSVI